MQKEEARTIKLIYTKQGKTQIPVMGKQHGVIDNLRVLYLVVESMCLNEKRGISDVLESAYLLHPRKLLTPTHC